MFGHFRKFFAFLLRIWRRYVKTDVKFEFLVKICFRRIYYHICTTTKHQKYIHNVLAKVGGSG